MLTTVRSVFRLIGPQRRIRFVLVWLLAIVVTALEAVAAILVLVLMRLVLEPGEIPEVPVLGDPTRWLPWRSYEELVFAFAVIFAVFFVLRGLVFLAHEYAGSRVSETTGVSIAHRLVTAYLAAPYEFHLQRNTAELIRNAYDNSQQLVPELFKPMITLVSESVMVVVMLAVLLITSPTATFAAAGLMGLIIFATFAFVQPRLQRLGTRRQNGARGAIQHLQQALGGLRDIKVLHRERMFTQGFLEARQEMADARAARSVLTYVPRVSIETTFLLFVLAVLVIGVSRSAVEGVLPVLGLFAYAGLRVQPSLQKIARALNSFRYAEKLAEEVRDDLDLLETAQKTDETDESEGAAVPLPFEDGIRFEDVGFHYRSGGEPALDGIEVVIHKGESIGIAGATGGGKTTLTDLLCGLLSPTHGRITVDGVDIENHTRAWQQNIGIAYQSSFLIDDTLRRNVAFGVPDREVDEGQVHRAIEMAELTDVVAELPEGLDTVVGERGVRLSGGQRQRVTLARALYRQPRLLILDEGTSALDNTTEARVMRNLERLHGDTTLIMVAHRLTTIMDCDRILLLDGGRLRAVGTYDELKHRDTTFRAMALSRS